MYKSKTRRATWTYMRNYLHILLIAKLLKQTYITIAFKTRNTIETILNRTPKPTNTTIQVYTQINMFRSQNNSHIGHKGRWLKIKFKEHIRNIRTKKEDDLNDRQTRKYG
jgi:hypothetical protein